MRYNTFHRQWFRPTIKHVNLCLTMDLELFMLFILFKLAPLELLNCILHSSSVLVRFQPHPSKHRPATPPWLIDLFWATLTKNLTACQTGWCNGDANSYSTSSLKVGDASLTHLKGTQGGQFFLLNWIKTFFYWFHSGGFFFSPVCVNG